MAFCGTYRFSAELDADSSIYLEFHCENNIPCGFSGFIIFINSTHIYNL